MEENLRNSEFRYRQLFESSPLPILVYDVETLKFLAVNDEVVRHYGYSREELEKMTIKNFARRRKINFLSGTSPNIEVPALKNLTPPNIKRKTALSLMSKYLPTR